MNTSFKENDEKTKEPKGFQRTRTAPPLEIPHSEGDGQTRRKPFVLMQKDGKVVKLSEMSSNEESGKTDKHDSERTNAPSSNERFRGGFPGNEQASEADAAKALEEDNKNDDIFHTSIEDTNSSTTKATYGSNEDSQLADKDMEYIKDSTAGIPEYTKFVQIEMLLREFPYVEEVDLQTKVNSLLELKERAMVSFILKFPKKNTTSAIEAYNKNLQKREFSCIEIVRGEFNRVAESNVDDVTKKVLAIVVKTIDEMKAISAFIFEKTITEKLYLNLYITIIKDLRKDWKCLEEMSMENRKTTCFYSTLHVYMLKRIEMVQNWNNDIDLASIKTADANEFEAQLEELESERLAKKKQSIGTVQLMAALYNQGADGSTYVVKAITELVKKTSSEHIEMLCELIKLSGNRLNHFSHGASVKAAYEHLERHMDSFNLRMKCLIKNTLTKIGEYMKINSSHEKTENRFATLSEKQEEAAEEEKPSDREATFTFVMSLLPRIQNEDDVSDEIRRFISEHPPEIFLSQFLSEMITNHKRFMSMRMFFEKKLYRIFPNYKEVLLTLKDEASFLVSEYPIVNRLYAEFLMYLRAADLISPPEFKTLQTPEFSKHSEMLKRKWKEDQDDRLEIVFPDKEK